MTSRSTVYARAEFEGFHRWGAAPPIHAFLGKEHRHIFRIKAEVPVTHDDRDVEFIALGRLIRSVVREWWGEPADLGTRSCEDVARDLARALDATSVDVSEDGENGAIHSRCAGGPLIVGQAPARATDGLPALACSASGRRLADLLGIGAREVGAAAETLNLLQRWPGRARGGGGDAFDEAAARRSAALLRLGGRSIVVALGAATARALGVAKGEASRPLGISEARGGARIFVLPHPSGSNRWWNSKDNVEAARRSLRRDVLPGLRR